MKPLTWADVDQPPVADLRALVASPERTTTGWRMDASVADLMHVIEGPVYSGPRWDFLEVSVLWVSPVNRWQITGRRWTTVAGWDARKFYGWYQPDQACTAAEALDYAERLLADLVGQLAAGTLHEADKG